MSKKADFTERDKGILLLLKKKKGRITGESVLKIWRNFSYFLRSKAYWGYERSWLETCKPEIIISESQIKNWVGYVVEIENEIAGFWCR